ncbi:MAG: trehalose-phosphatase [Kiloniellales bacterium]
MNDAPARPSQGRPISSLPSARAEAAAIAERLAGRRLALFLDYDGTLSAIAERPELALLDPAMRQVVRALAERCFVAVISGRDLEDVRAKVGIEELVYAGSHGFDIAGPPNAHSGDTRSAGAHPGQGGEALQPALDAAEAGLRLMLAGLSGLLVERKRYSLAVHVRQVAPAGHERVAQAVDVVLAEHPALALVRGKMVFELRPAVDWDKGRAMLWLLRFLDGKGTNVVPIYIGDDITDEDAFRALHELGGPDQIDEGGIGIVVGGDQRDSLADYVLARPDEVRAFLDFLLRLLNGASPAAAAEALAG